jgi:hypothetical protein
VQTIITGTHQGQIIEEWRFLGRYAMWLVQFLNMIYVFGNGMFIGGLFRYPGCILYASMENKYYYYYYYYYYVT